MPRDSDKAEQAAEVIRMLRRIRAMVDKGWLTYGGLYGWNVHALVLPGKEGMRYLTVAELRPYTRGFWDAKALGKELPDLDGKGIPQLITQQAAAERLGVSYARARRYHRLAVYYPVFTGVYQRFIIEAELAADIVARSPSGLPKGPVRRWQQIKATLPERSEHPLEDLKPSAEAPAVEPTMIVFDRRLAVLGIAADQGWLTVAENHAGRSYSLLTPPTTGGAGPTKRTLPARDVEPYVWGMGDSHGLGRLVTSRAGLS